MIKITQARHVAGTGVELRFSDGSLGVYDFTPIIAHDTVLTRPLGDPDYFRSFFLELGALAWSNGLELSGSALHEEMLHKGTLHFPSRTAQGS
jgi:hypothetical protein